MSSDSLTDRLQYFLGTDQFEVKPLAGGASSRKYYQIDLKKKLYFPSKRILLMTIPLEEIDTVTDYVHIDFYLQRMGVPTPKVYEMKKYLGWIFLEHENSPTLLTYLQKNSAQTDKLIENLIEFLIHIQERCQFEDHCPAFHRFFDKEKYLYEFDFHVKNQLLTKYFKLHLSKEEQNDFQNFSLEISQTLVISEKVFVHRDFQSSNIFYDRTKIENSFKIIDFQDARSGSPIYDVVSCLWDSYITINEELRNRLLEKFSLHLKKRGTLPTKNDFQKLVDFTVIQRKLHDAGAFAYNYHRFNIDKFTSFISPAIQMALEKMKLYDQFKNVVKIFEKIGERS